MLKATTDKFHKRLNKIVKSYCETLNQQVKMHVMTAALNTYYASSVASFPVLPKDHQFHYTFKAFSLPRRSRHALVNNVTKYYGNKVANYYCKVKGAKMEPEEEYQECANEEKYYEQGHVQLAEVSQNILTRIQELKENTSKSGIQRALSDLFRTLKDLKIDSVMTRPLKNWEGQSLNSENPLFRQSPEKYASLVSKISGNQQRIRHYQQVFRTDANFAPDLDKQSILKSQAMLSALFNCYHQLVHGLQLLSQQAALTLSTADCLDTAAPDSDSIYVRQTPQQISHNQSRL